MQTDLTLRSRLALCAAALCSACACAPDREVFRFRYANAQPAHHPRSVSMEFFEGILEDRTDGRVQVETYFGGSLGRERALMDLVTLNVLQGTRGGFFFDVNPRYNIFLLPFLVQGWDEALRLVNSDFAARVNAESRKYGYHVPACGISQGFRAHTTSVRPITGPEDFKGLNLRVPPQEPNVILTEALGATPQEIPFTEVYQAAKTGVIDGQDNAPSNLWETGIHEVQEYLSPDPFIVNLDWYEALPASLQVEFDRAAREAIAYSDRMNRDSEEQYIAKLSRVLETNRIEGAGLEQFREAAMPVYDVLVGRGYFTWDDIREAQLAARAD